MNIRPLNNRVLVKLNENESESSGILLPDNSNVSPRTAEVISIGDTITHINIGDTILLPKSELTEVDVDDSTHFIVTDDEILAVI